jgi:hypothetical protein
MAICKIWRIAHLAETRFGYLATTRLPTTHLNS